MWGWDVGFPTNDLRNGLFRWFLKNLTFGLNEFHQIVFENECGNDAQNTRKSWRIVEFWLFCIRLCAKNQYLRLQTLFIAFRHYIAPILTRIHTHNTILVAFGENRHGAPFHFQCPTNSGSALKGWYSSAGRVGVDISRSYDPEKQKVFFIFLVVLVWFF